MFKLSESQVDDLVAIAYGSTREQNIAALARMGVFPRAHELGGKYDAATLRWIAERRLLETGSPHYSAPKDKARTQRVVYPPRTRP